MSCLRAFVLISLIKFTIATHLRVFQNLTTEALFLETVRQIFVEEPFETLFLLKTTNNSCISSNDVWKYLKVPMLIASVGAPEDKLKDRFNSKQLAITCLSGQLDHQLLNVLAANLQYRRQTRIILHVAVARPTPTLLTSLQTFLADQHMPNVIAIFSNFYTEYNFYRYHPFPSGHWALEFLDKTDRYFLCYYANMQGKIFTTLPIQIAPVSIIYEDAVGQQRLSGYVGYLMIAFAEKYNFTWQYLYPVTQGNNLSITDLVRYVLEGKLDFAITLSTASYRPEERYPYMSYTVGFMNWFIVLPCPQPIAYSEIYTVIVTTQVIGILIILDLLFSLLETFMKHTFYKHSAEFNLANILINVNIVRGIFGLSFLISRRPILSLKMLYIWLFLLGLFVNNMYSAYFQTLFTSPPLEQKILSFDDMRRANLKIMFSREQIKVVQNLLGSGFDSIFQDILQVEDSESYDRHRSEFDTTYAYSMPEVLWPIFDLQQRTFERKIFCLAPTLKFFDHVMLSIPLAENSYVVEPLNMLILRAIETGLVDHWRTMTLMDMWATGQLSLKDNSNIEQLHNIRVEDMKFPWYLLLCGLGVSSLGLLTEIYVHKLKMGTRYKRGKGKIAFKLRKI